MHAWYIACSQHGGISGEKSKVWTGGSVEKRLKRRVMTAGDQEEGKGVSVIGLLGLILIPKSVVPRVDGGAWAVAQWAPS